MSITDITDEQVRHLFRLAGNAPDRETAFEYLSTVFRRSQVAPLCESDEATFWAMVQGLMRGSVRDAEGVR